MVGLTQPPSSVMLDDLFTPRSFSILVKERGAGENLPPLHPFQQKIELECADKKKQQTFGLWEKARVGCFKRTALKQVYYLG